MTKFLILLGTTIFLSACGSNSLIKSISVKSETDTNSQSWVQLAAALNLGQLNFPSLTIPIVHPKHSNQTIGNVSLGLNADGSNAMILNANLSELLSNSQFLDQRLPNGQNIPISGMPSVFSFRIKDKSKLYLGVNQTQIMLGLALVIPLFDQVGSLIPGVNVFLPLPKESKISGLAGVFTGDSGNNGLGLFTLFPNTLALPTKAIAQKLSMSPQRSSESANIVLSNLTQNKSIQVQRYFYNLSIKKRTLTIE